MTSTSIFEYQEPRRLHGIPGVVYVLMNTALKENIVRVGLSRRSGWAKAAELNRDKTNTIPGNYECVFESRAQDGGAAIEAIGKELQDYHFGKKEHDFFQVEHDLLEEIVNRLVAQTNQQVYEQHQKTSRMRAYLLEMAQDNQRQDLEYEERQSTSSEEIQKEMNRHKREGIFDKANVWVNKILS